MIFSLREIFFGKGRSSGVPLPLGGFEARWSYTDREVLPSLLMTLSQLPTCPLRGGTASLGKTKELPSNLFWEIILCRDGILVSPREKGAELARLLPLATFLTTSLPRLSPTSCWTMRRGGK